MAERAASRPATVAAIDGSQNLMSTLCAPGAR
jgi:hypothetical protein